MIFKIHLPEKVLSFIYEHNTHVHSCLAAYKCVKCNLHYIHTHTHTQIMVMLFPFYLLKFGSFICE